jgi:hypothetical protein
VGRGGTSGFPEHGGQGVVAEGMRPRPEQVAQPPGVGEASFRFRGGPLQVQWPAGKLCGAWVFDFVGRRYLMRMVTGIVPVAVLLGFAMGVAGADTSKDKATDNLKPNQVLLKVPGMH